MIQGDIYNYTIAANMMKACSPIELNYCLKQCSLTFLFQCVIAYSWILAFRDDSEYQYQPFNVYQTSISITCAVLFQKNI